MASDNIIDSLVLRHHARRAVSPWRFVFVSVVLVTLAGALTHYLFDHQSFMAASTLKTFNLIGYFISSVFAVMAAFESGIPGSKRGMRFLTIAGVLAVLSSLLVFADSPMSMAPAMIHYSCAFHTMLLSLIPLLLLVIFQKKLATCNRTLTNAAIVIACISLSGIWMSYACPIGQMLHVSLFHFFIPALLLFGFFQLLSKKLWRW